MKTKQYGVVLTLGFLIAASVFAGDRVGNSSKTVVCYDRDREQAGAEITSVELLDFFEAMEVRSLTINLSDADVDTMVLEGFERLHEKDPERSERYIQAYKGLKKTTKFTKRATIREIDDGWTRIEGKNFCYIRQFAVQSAPRTQFDPWILGDEVLWEKMPALQRAGFWIHEAILHEEVKARGPNQGIDTDGIRSFVGILSSNGFASLDLAEYAYTLKALLFDAGIPVMIDEIALESVLDFSVHPNARLKTGILREEKEFSLGSGLKVFCLPKTRIELDEEGKLVSCQISSFQPKSQTDRIYFSGGLLTRSKDGKIYVQNTYDYPNSPALLNGGVRDTIQLNSAVIPVNIQGESYETISALCPELEKEFTNGMFKTAGVKVFSLSEDGEFAIELIIETTERQSPSQSSIWFGTEPLKNNFCSDIKKYTLRKY